MGAAGVCGWYTVMAGMMTKMKRAAKTADSYSSAINIMLLSVKP